MNRVEVDRALVDEMLEAVLDFAGAPRQGRPAGDAAAAERLLRAAYELGGALHGEHGWRQKAAAWAGRRGMEALDRARKAG